MSEFIISGIVIGASDRAEADKLLKILTPSHGVISAVIKGVKKEKAKLKPAAMPFSFCEYKLVSRGGLYTVISAQQIESLFDICIEPESYLAASVMAEAAAFCSGADSARIFILFLSALKRMIFSETDPFSIALNVVFRLLVFGGHVAPRQIDSQYDCDINEQKSLDTGGRQRLKQLLILFCEKFSCEIRSARLL